MRRSELGAVEPEDAGRTAADNRLFIEAVLDGSDWRSLAQLARELWMLEHGVSPLSRWAKNGIFEKIFVGLWRLKSR